MEIEELMAKLLGRRDFCSLNEIIDFAKKSKHYNSNKENLNQAKALKIFQTSKQKTWLVSTNKRLYCILDDNREEIPHVKWSIPKSDIIDDDKISIEIKTREHSEKSGLVDIGPKVGWKYSKKLFTKVNIKKSIKNLITETML